MDDDPILTTQGLCRDFAGFRAVGPVDLAVAEGTVVALVGPNGAGKTTLFNLLTGFLAPSAGRISFAGRDITGLPPERIAALGVARSFQVTSLFARMGVREHVELALQAGSGLGRRFWRGERLMRRFSARAGDLLDEVGLADLAERPAGSLPYGHKRALELALALALEPRLLLLDEPTAGMGREDVDRTVALIARIRTGRTVVMVEHNMDVVGSLADTVTVLTPVFGFGTALAGLAGVLAAPMRAVNSGMGADLIITVFAVVVIGGLGSVFGSVVAGFAVGMLQALGSLYVPVLSQTSVYLLMAVVLLVRPAGLFGTEENI